MANEAYVYMRVSGQFSPDEFTSSVGLIPTKIIMRGERDADLVIPKKSHWSLKGQTAKGDYIDMYDLADEFLLPLSDKCDVLRDVARSYEAEIQVGMVIFISVFDSVPTPAIGLSASAISIMERLGASLDIDTYRNDKIDIEK